MTTTVIDLLICAATLGLLAVVLDHFEKEDK